MSPDGAFLFCRVVCVCVCVCVCVFVCWLTLPGERTTRKSSEEKRVWFHNVCLTLALHRSHQAHRFTAIAADADSVIHLLSIKNVVAKIAEHTQRSALLSISCDSLARSECFYTQLSAALTAPRVVYMFGGQGSQYAGMCRELLSNRCCFVRA